VTCNRENLACNKGSLACNKGEKKMDGLMARIDLPRISEEDQGRVIDFLYNACEFCKLIDESGSFIGDRHDLLGLKRGMDALYEE